LVTKTISDKCRGIYYILCNILYYGGVVVGVVNKKAFGEKIEKKTWGKRRKREKIAL